MQLLLINGSPRNKKSNSLLLINEFLKGYREVVTEDVPVYHLADKKTRPTLLQEFSEAETVIVFFPLYTDSMPGIVKAFIEDLTTIKFVKTKNIGFVVQSGFPESIHSVFVERYLVRLCKRLKLNYLGSVIKGGVEGIQIMPGWMTRSLFKKFRKLGKYFAFHQGFSPKILKQLLKPYRLSKSRLLWFSLMQKTGWTNFYWDSSLKKNGSFDRRDDQPYQMAKH